MVVMGLKVNGESILGGGSLYFNAPIPLSPPPDLSSRKWGGSPRVERSPALNPVAWSSLHPRNHLGGFLTATEAGPHTQKLQIGVSAAVWSVLCPLDLCRLAAEVLV